MAYDTTPPTPRIDMHGFTGIATGPGIAGVLTAGMIQSLGHWHGTDAVAAAGGAGPLLLGTTVLLYAMFALVHLLHAVADGITGRKTPLWWNPGLVGEDEETADAPPAAPLFPNHVDGAVLSGGLALAAWLVLTGTV